MGAIAPLKDEKTALIPSLRARHVLLPAVFQFTQDAQKHVLEFFAAHLRNRNTRKAYARRLRTSEPGAPSTSILP